MSKKNLSLIRTALLVGVILWIVTHYKQQTDTTYKEKQRHEEASHTDNRSLKVHFISLAPVYFFSAAYIAQSALKEPRYDHWIQLPPEMGIAISVFLVVVAIYSICAALVGFRESIMRKTYEAAVILGVPSMMIYFIDWLEHVGLLAELGADVRLLYLFFFGGYAVVISVMGYHIIKVFSLFRNKY